MNPCQPGVPPLPLKPFFTAVAFFCTSLVWGQTAPEPTAGNASSAQQGWQWRAVDSTGSIPWPQAFAFSEIIPVNGTVLPGRWLSLTPRDGSWEAAFYDTVDKRLVALAPDAHTLCKGVTVDRVVKALHARETGLDLEVRYTMQFASGTIRRSGGTGQLDAKGQWRRYPFGTTMPRPDGCPVVNDVTPPGPLVDMSVPPLDRASDPLELVEVLSQPALRERVGGRWVTPQPSSDPVIAQWQTHRLIARESPVISAYGVINAAGQVVVPTIFGALSDVEPNASLHIELVREGNIQHQQTLRLRVGSAKSFAKGFRTAQDASGKWGYVNAKGDWVIPARFDAARPFVNGYAVVTGAMPDGWRPENAAPGIEHKPMVQSITRLGHAWVIGVAPPVAATSEAPGRGGRAVMDETGRWLVPESRGESITP